MTEIKDLGGGWYELPNGEKVQGEMKADLKYQEWKEQQEGNSTEQNSQDLQGVEFPAENPQNQVPETDDAAKTTPTIQNVEKPPQKDYSGTNAILQGDDDDETDIADGIDGDAGTGTTGGGDGDA